MMRTNIPRQVAMFHIREASIDHFLFVANSKLRKIQPIFKFSVPSNVICPSQSKLFVSINISLLWKGFLFIAIKEWRYNGENYQFGPLLFLSLLCCIDRAAWAHLLIICEDFIESLHSSIHHPSLTWLRALHLHQEGLGLGWGRPGEDGDQEEEHGETQHFLQGLVRSVLCEAYIQFRSGASSPFQRSWAFVILLWRKQNKVKP